MRRVLSVLTAVVFLAVGFVPAAGAATPYYMVKNAESMQCMGIAGGRMVNGTKVIQWPCNGANRDQQWYTSGGQFASRKDPSFCLSAPNNWTSPGLQLQIWKCQGATGQNWAPAMSVEGAQVISNSLSFRFAAVAGGSHAPGAAVVQWDSTEKAEQHWVLTRYQEV